VLCATEAWLQAGKYAAALMSGLPRRNGWTIAEHVGDRAPDKTQRLLSRAVWDTAAAMAVVRAFAVAGLDQAARRAGRRNGLVVGAVDETSQVKQGEHTAGVKRHYLGCAGKVANGITTVHLAYVREHAGHALIGARQWIPAGHLGDPVKSAGMGLPADMFEGTTAVQIAHSSHRGSRDIKDEHQPDVGGQSADHGHKEQDGGCPSAGARQESEWHASIRQHRAAQCYPMS
jgi:hypothetical protein